MFVEGSRFYNNITEYQPLGYLKENHTSDAIEIITNIAL